ncbi:MAG: TonB family protein [Bacteroidota bacterium]
MKRINILSILLILSLSSWAQSNKHSLEPGSEVLFKGANQTAEKVNDTLYILKRFNTETKSLVRYVSFNSKDFKTKNGLYKSLYDDGTVVTTGHFRNNVKHGLWIENQRERGIYVKGKKEGRWEEIYASENDRVIKEEYYVNGRLHGKTMRFDSLNNVEWEAEYIEGKLISTTQDTSTKMDEELPRFPGCENEDMTVKEKEKCATEKLKKFIYKNLKYPKSARKRDIQGQALVQFNINEGGNIVDNVFLRGVSKSIRKECLRLLKKMPKWRPGHVDGKAVKVQYKLPIRFNLE